MTDHEYLRELSARIMRNDEKYLDYDSLRLQDIADRIVRMEATSDILVRVWNAKKGKVS